MKRTLAIILTICMAVTGTLAGIPEMVKTGDGMEASAASYPALKKISYKATGNQRDDIIGFAKSQIGYKEGSGNNTYFGSWFGCNYNPWCAMFVCWSARKAGVTKDVIPSLATADRSWAKKQGVYYKSKYWGGSYTPKKGDLIYFSWSVRDWADHIGMVTGTGKSGGTTYVYTVEGNKHDKVVEGKYPINNRYILGYTSPKYTTGKAKATTTTTTKAPTTYTLKYRDGLDVTSNDEEDKIIPPVKGTFGKALTLSTKKFKRSGYGYVQWDIYKENSSGALVYLCVDKKTGKTEKWVKKSAIPSDYRQVLIDCGGSVTISKAFSGTVYVSPVWKKGLKETTKATTKATTTKQTTTKSTSSTSSTAAGSSFTVTYNAAGGNSAPAKQTKSKGKTLTLSTSKPVRDGYEFLGWAKKFGATKADFAAGAAYKTDANLTLYAVWKLKSYNVITTAGVNTRSGPGTDYDTVSTLDLGTKKAIYDISGDWGKIEDGTWISLQYAPRLESNSYFVEYRDGNNSTKDDSNYVGPAMGTYGKAFVTTTTKFKKKGYHYSNWKVLKEKDGRYVYYCRDKATGKKEKWCPMNDIPPKYKIKKVKVGEKIKIRKNAGERIFMNPVWEKDATKMKTTSDVNKRKGPGSDYDVIGSIAKGKTVYIVKKKNGWGKLKKGGWISMKYVKKPSAKKDKKTESKKKKKKETKAQTPDNGAFTVKVTASGGVNARTGPSKKKDIQESYEKGTSLKVTKVKNGWGKLKKNDCWIMLKYTKITSGYKVKITADDLNQRKGPGTKYDVKGVIDPGTYHIVKINGDWGKVKETKCWVYLSYTKRIK